MWFKHRAWIPAAWVASVGNLVAVWFAAQPAEPWHATTHAVLAVAFALGARRLKARRRAIAQDDQLQDAIDENEQLQHTVDDMQVHVQELEGRVEFAERLLAQQREQARINKPRADS